MVRKTIIYSLIVIFAWSCKNNTVASSEENISQSIEISAICDFITKSWIISNFEIEDEENVQITGVNQDSTSYYCFYKWSWGEMGFILKIKEYSSIDEAMKFVETRSDVGSQNMEGEIFEYVPFTGFGDAGVYNKNLEEYYWYREKYVFGMSLNIEGNAEDQLNFANKIASEYMKGF